MKTTALAAVLLLTACGGGGNSAPAHVDYQFADVEGVWSGDGVSRDKGPFHCQLRLSQQSFGGAAEFTTIGYSNPELGFSAIASIIDGDTLDIVSFRARIVSTVRMEIDSDIFTGDHLRITLTR